jgi:hypothetical protein
MIAQCAAETGRRLDHTLASRRSKYPHAILAMSPCEALAVEHCYHRRRMKLAERRRDRPGSRCEPAPARWPLPELRPFRCPTMAHRGIYTVGSSAR